MSQDSSDIVQLDGVTHLYGASLALDSVDLKTPSRCMAGLIGPDGVGKSTLLALVAGARKIQTGSVRILGGDMRSLAFRTAVSPSIAYMPQGLGGNLYATLSVFENVDFFGRLFGQARDERESRAEDLLASTGFGLLLSTFVKTQIAAIFAAVILSIVPSINFSGFMSPVSSLSGGAKLVGYGFPSSYFQVISVGTFTKGLGFETLMPSFAILALFVVVFLCLSLFLLRAQEA